MSDKRWAADISLLPGELVAEARSIQIRTVVGSCVAVCLWDRKQHVGGMNHYLLPEPLAGEAPSTRYGTLAMQRLIEQVCRIGGACETMDAAIIGGGSPMQAIRIGAIGERNAAVALTILRQYSIRVVRQETGGKHGRKLLFNPQTGELTVTVVRGIPALPRGTPA